MQVPDYIVIAFYHFCPIPDQAAEVQAHKDFFIGRDVRARTYISAQGINGQMSALRADGEAYIEWLRSRPEFQGVEFKIDSYHEHVFPRLTIKVKKELVALGEELSFDERGEYLEPKEWGQMLESCQDKLLLDIRNDYEWKLGRFDGAEQVTCETFKDFIQMAQDLKKRLEGKSTKVMMYCTGGIRCEVFSALLKKEGMQNDVFQLHGGVIRYGQVEKSKHWLGKLFVFDDRLQVDISDEKAPSIAECHHCKETAGGCVHIHEGAAERELDAAKANAKNHPEVNSQRFFTRDDSEAVALAPSVLSGIAPRGDVRYYNCANVACNKLFLCCVACLEKSQGCCQSECQSAERVRPFQFAHKPFRRWYNYAKSAEAHCEARCEVSCKL